MICSYYLSSRDYLLSQMFLKDIVNHIRRRELTGPVLLLCFLHRGNVNSIGKTGQFALWLGKLTSLQQPAGETRLPGLSLTCICLVQMLHKILLFGGGCVISFLRSLNFGSIPCEALVSLCGCRCAGWCEESKGHYAMGLLYHLHY